MASEPRSPSAIRRGVLVAVAILTIPVSLLTFARSFGFRSAVLLPLAPIAELTFPFHSINTYGLFAVMTTTRQEIIVEGSDDGVEWKAYEFRYKPGDPDRAPPFVAPHQPRVDFLMWFLTLGGRATYFERLLELLRTNPRAVAPLFVRDPFPDSAPDEIRLAIYRYRFTDLATRRATGAWWSRELLGYSRPVAR